MYSVQGSCDLKNKKVICPIQGIYIFFVNTVKVVWKLKIPEPILFYFLALSLALHNLSIFITEREILPFLMVHKINTYPSYEIINGLEGNECLSLEIKLYPYHELQTSWAKNRRQFVNSYPVKMCVVPNTYISIRLKKTTSISI